MIKLFCARSARTSRFLLLASIEVIPEYKTGIGNLDFLFLGSVKGEGICRLAAEFKRAQSNDVYNGLEKQLPAYMRASNAKYGAYCVLGFKGDWFDEPRGMSLHDLEFQLKLRQLESSDPAIRTDIRVFLYDLSKPVTASKL